MAANLTEQNAFARNRWRILGWGAAAGLLALPALAMRFTPEVRWDETDFIVMGLMLGSAGLILELLIRRSASLAYRLGSAAALLATFLIIWANLAVGMIGSEENGYNLLFFGVIAIAWSGAGAGLFRPDGMTRAMGIAAALHAIVALAGMPADPRGGIFSVIMGGLWLVSALLYRRARS